MSAPKARWLHQVGGCGVSPSRQDGQRNSAPVLAHTWVSFISYWFTGVSMYCEWLAGQRTAWSACIYCCMCVVGYVHVNAVGYGNVYVMRYVHLYAMYEGVMV